NRGQSATDSPGAGSCWPLIVSPDGIRSPTIFCAKLVDSEVVAHSMGNHVRPIVCLPTVDNRSHVTAVTTTVTRTPMNIYAVDYVDDESCGEGPDELRLVPVEFLQDCFDKGRLLVSGQVDDGAVALLIITGQDEAHVLKLMDNDPFAKNELLTARTIRKWGVVFGKDKLTATGK